VKVTIRTIELHLTVPFAISRATHTTKKVILVELREGDRVSRGEGVPDAFFGETPESVERDIRGAIDALSEDPRDLQGLQARLEERFPHGGAACCAIDVLAHDRASQAAGVTLRDFLGLAGGEPPPTSFTIGIAEPQVMAERAAKAAAQGFTVLKVKLGQGDAVAALSAIRERFSGTMRVDPNAAWTAAEAPARIASLVPFDLEFVEQPIDPKDIDGLRRVRAASPLPIVADEAAIRASDVPRLVGACDGINVKLQKCGGVAAARAMIAVAHESGLKVMLGCRAAETSVAIAAAVENGRFVFPKRPGLGAIPAA